MVVGVARTSTAFLHQRVGHTVKVGVEGDVVVDVDSGVGPLAHVEPLSRHRVAKPGARSLRNNTGPRDPSRPFLNGRWFSRSEEFADRTVSDLPTRKNFWVA